ncbi:hypothetical protein [Halostella litorea]|uniref:hypothetical protein n=1 Tax=Halostella litorea TaxID=2528831 RepID=UPI00192A24E3|nr:hypothetical protein [Halostella litorea]
MLAREWAIAGSYGAPAEYGIPELPEWRVTRLRCGGLVLAGDDGEPFISAERPVAVRR